MGPYGIKKKEALTKENEQVLVTPNNPGIHYATGDYFHLEAGGSRSWEDEVISKACFVDRWMAEEDPTTLQIIPYVLLLSQDRKVFSYRRKGGGEKRLDGKSSIGVGGHINPIDTDGAISWSTVKNAACREVAEEVNIMDMYVQKNIFPLGTVYAPTDAGGKEHTPGPKVGEVHLGVVYGLLVADVVEVREKQLIKPKFISHPRNVGRYERWSQLILKRLTEIKKII
jgi:predicted NUDIX family phosphoesterase